jgi:hypothetical protein
MLSNSDQGLVDAEFTQYFLPRAFSTKCMTQIFCSDTSHTLKHGMLCMIVVEEAKAAVLPQIPSVISENDDSIKVESIDDDDDDGKPSRCCVCYKSDILVLPIYYRFLGNLMTSICCWCHCLIVDIQSTIV